MYMVAMSKAETSVHCGVEGAEKSIVQKACQQAILRKIESEDSSWMII